MKIEQEEIIFERNNLTSLQLTELQKNYLNILLVEKTIEKTFLFYLQQGWLINFNEFLSLLKSLASTKSIHNLNFYHFITNLSKHDQSTPQFPHNSTISSLKIQNLNLREKIFFRSLPENIYALFLKNAEIIEVPKNSLLIREGDRTRDMYYLINGKAAVYKTKDQQKIRIADITPECVFGEANFLWSSERTADVVSATNCQLVRFKYSESDFKNIINADLAKSSQIRFWELHALMKSPLLKNIPYESFDELLNTGKKISLKKSELLFSENSFGASFYIVVQGNLRVFQNQKPINQLGQGDLFGEISLFISGGKRTATVSALTDCVLIEISKDYFYKMLSRNFLLACEIESLAWERMKRDQVRVSA